MFYDVLEGEIFPKALAHSLAPKLAVLSSVYFSKNRPGECVLECPRTIKCNSRL